MGENQTKSEDFEKKEGVLTIGEARKGWPLSSACSRCKVHKIEDMSIFPSVLKTVDGTFLSHKALLRSVFSEKKLHT